MISAIVLWLCCTQMLPLLALMLEYLNGVMWCLLNMCILVKSGLGSSMKVANYDFDKYWLIINGVRSQSPVGSFIAAYQHQYIYVCSYSLRLAATAGDSFLAHKVCKYLLFQRLTLWIITVRLNCSKTLPLKPTAMGKIWGTLGEVNVCFVSYDYWCVLSMLS